MNKPKKIIGFVGMIASGKGVAARYIVEKYGASYYRFSTMLRNALDRFYLENSRENMQLISTILRKNFDEDVMSKTMAADIAKDANPLIVIDGVRRLADIVWLEKNPDFFLVSIEADAETRYRRVVARAENPGDAKKTFERFLADEKEEADAEIPSVMEKARTKIDNNGTAEDLKKQLDKIVQNS